MSHKFFIPSEIIDLKNKVAILKDEEYQHAAKVLRLNIKDTLLFFDGCGTTYEAQITAKKSKSFHLRIEKQHTANLDYSLEVYIGHPKGKKIDVITNALTQMGATTIGTFTSDFTQGKPEKKRKDQRLRKITIEACKQSGSPMLPKLDLLIDFDQLIERLDTKKKKIIFYENADEYVPLSSMSAKDVIIVIGPEGGFSDNEVRRITDSGAIATRLNDSLLRVQTASIAATGLLRYSQKLAGY